ncbi:hypothetical protein MOKP4_20420 [Mycobacterium avium subsp. hominissuis]
MRQQQGGRSGAAAEWVWPAVISARNSAPPPTSANAPRRLIVAGPGSAAASPPGRQGSGSVSAAGVRRTARIDIERSPAHIRRPLIVTCMRNPMTNTQAPK